LQEKNTQTLRKIQQHVMFILIGAHVRHFSDENQTVSNIKKINHGLPLCPNKVNGVYNCVEVMFPTIDIQILQNKLMKCVK
jgi:uncharacterized membrane protein